MTELARHIENLLFSNDCVIVPQLGGFVTHHVPAHYNEAEGLYMPPSRSVGFNPQLQLNDGLLVQAYMLANPGISFPEANELLEADINLLKSQLQAEGEYLLEGVGCLSVGMDGKYTFKLVDEANKPVEGVSLQFCVGDSCRPGTTDENGIFEIECDEPVEAHVQMLNAGDSGLSFEDFYTTKTQFEYTIVMK